MTTPRSLCRHLSRAAHCLLPHVCQCLKFVTDQAQDLKRIDKLNSLFLTFMCGKDPATEAAEEQQGSKAVPERPGSSEDPGSKKKAKKR